MNKGYLTREQVVAKFKLEVLPSIIKEVGNDFSIIQHCWDVTLEQLESGKQITTSQKNKWKIKESDLL